MTKLKYILKVLTFINFKITLMSLIMLFSVIFGVIYTNSSIEYTKRISNSISENSGVTVKLSESMNKFNLLGNLVNSKSLKMEKFDDQYDKYVSYKDSFELTRPELKKIDSLLIAKKQALNRIYFERVKNKISNQSDSVLMNTIYYVNSLDYQINHLLNFKISILNKRSIKYQNTLSKQLQDRFLSYVIIMSINFILFGLISWLLISDIRKRDKSDERRRDFISFILNRK